MTRWIPATPVQGGARHTSHRHQTTSRISALQDQHFDLGAIDKRIKSEDQRRAFEAVVEGEVVATRNADGFEDGANSALTQHGVPHLANGVFRPVEAGTIRPSDGICLRRHKVSDKIGQVAVRVGTSGDPGADEWPHQAQLRTALAQGLPWSE